MRPLVLIIGVAATYAACTRIEGSGPAPNVPIGQGGFAGEAEGGSGTLAGAAGDGDGGTGFSYGGAPHSLELGLWPTYFAAADDVGNASAVIASLATLSAGSRTLPIYERWDELSGATGSPRAVAWAKLDAVAKPYIDQGKDIALCIGVVDRKSAAWPVNVELDTEEAFAAMDRTVDEVLAHFAPRLAHLCFGYQVDRYLSQVTDANRAPLRALLSHAIDYARNHPSRSPATLLGVAVSLDAVAAAEHADDIALGDEVVAVYDPLDAAAALKSTSAVKTELTAALEALPLRDGEPVPLTLFEVGAPSAEAVGADEKGQKAFYDGLLATLAERARSLSFVGLYGLGDRAPTECDAEAPVFGDSEQDRAAARCSMGLRADTGAPKQAWPSVLQALSRYR